MNEEPAVNDCTNHDCYHHSLQASLTYKLPAYLLGVVVGFIVVQVGVALF